MGKVTMGLSMSLDGFIAGANDGPESPLGEGGERLLAHLKPLVEAGRCTRRQASAYLRAVKLLEV